MLCKLHNAWETTSKWWLRSPLNWELDSTLKRILGRKSAITLWTACQSMAPLLRSPLFVSNVQKQLLCILSLSPRPFLKRQTFAPFSALSSYYYYYYYYYYLLLLFMIILLLLFFYANIKKKQKYETNSVNIHSFIIHILFGPSRRFGCNATYIFENKCHSLKISMLSV